MDQVKTPIFFKALNTVRRGVASLRTRSGRRQGTKGGAGQNLLPLLIQVLANFSKIDGTVLEEEIDSILGFLRYDYPEAIYSELRKHFRKALSEQRDLSEMAVELSSGLPPDRKIMLGVQLYDLVSRAGLKQQQVVAYYSFMSQLGMAAQAIDIVYQLNASDEADPAIFEKGTSPLEALRFGNDERADVHIPALGPDERLLAFRYHDLILIRNLTGRPLTVRGRNLSPGAFCRVYPGERIILGEQIITHPDLAFYFNAKKNVELHQIYVTIGDGEEIEIEPTRGRESALEIVFALNVQVHALRDVDAVIRGIKLKAGTLVEATLEDVIVFANRGELPISDLRRRARAMGGRFHLKTHKSEYLVSNNPSLLGQDDILLSPGFGGEILLRIECDYDQRTGRLEVLQSDRPILLRESPVRGAAPLFDGDIIQIDPSQVLRCDFSDRGIQEERNVIRSVEIRDLVHYFPQEGPAIDGVSFSVARGEMLCIMGASGSGKSTLLRILAGQLRPFSGDVILNGHSLYENLDSLKAFIAHVPQDDSFDEHLTIAENLLFSAAMRSPHLTKRERERRVDSRLTELGLGERRDSVVGSPLRKNLSGGERKRLNIGLDMIGSADVYLFDEPTSGLSSKDSEQVIDILRTMAQNKIVLAVVHQPSSKIFLKFNKALLLDRGGRLVFFGTPREMLEYFANAEYEQHFEKEEHPDSGLIRPEFIFDVLEAPLRDLSGDIIFEENSRGQLVPARRHTPNYWRDKFESYHLMRDVAAAGAVQPSVRDSPPPPLPSPPKGIRWRSELTLLFSSIARAYKSKLRNRANIWTTIVAAPALALLIAGVLRYSESGSYDFASAFHIPSYLFLSLIVAMFLGLTNSADDIIRDRPTLQRERNLGIRIGYYITGKLLTLGLFGAVQCLLYLLIGHTLLEVRGMIWIHFSYMFLTSLSGIAVGLLISSLVSDSKTAANLVPLILVPQIILGGALIKYEEMNRNFDFVHSLRRFFSQEPTTGPPREVRSDLEVPAMCELMPTRWAYEAMILAQAKLNPVTRRQDYLQRSVKAVAAIRKPTPEDSRRLEALKNLLATISGLEAESPAEIDQMLKEIDRQAAGGIFDRRPFVPKKRVVSSEQLYINQKVTDLVSKSEFEEADYRRDGISVFFGRQKIYWGLKADTMPFNALVLLAFASVFTAVLHRILVKQLRI